MGKYTDVKEGRKEKTKKDRWMDRWIDRLDRFRYKDFLKKI